MRRFEFRLIRSEMNSIYLLELVLFSMLDCKV